MENRGSATANHMDHLARELPGMTGGTSPALRAVLFDMDGTLVETEQFWGVAMGELAARLGGRMSDEARSRTVGTSMSVSMAVLHADLGLTRTEAADAADARWVTDRTAELMAGGVEWRPGAAELLRAVRAAGLRTALVTTTPRRLAEIVLGSIRARPRRGPVRRDRLRGRGGRPASRIRRPTGRPWPHLGVEPGECLVIEDSRAGISAGLAAGVVVLGVPDAQSVPPAPGLRLLDSLLGVDVAALADLHAGRDLESTGRLTARARHVTRPPGRHLPAAGDHEAGPLQRRHVGQRIAVDQQQVGVQPGGQAPGAAVQAAGAGREPGRRGEGVGGRHAARGHEIGDAERHQAVALAGADARVRAGEQDRCRRGTARRRAEGAARRCRGRPRGQPAPAVAGPARERGRGSGRRRCRPRRGGPAAPAVCGTRWP